MKLVYSILGVSYFILFCLYFVAITGCGLGEDMIIDGSVIPVTIDNTDCCRLVTTNFGQGIPETYLGEDNDWEIVLPNGVSHVVYRDYGSYYYWTLFTDYEYEKNYVRFDDNYVFHLEGSNLITIEGVKPTAYEYVFGSSDTSIETRSAEIAYAEYSNEEKKWKLEITVSDTVNILEMLSYSSSK